MSETFDWFKFLIEHCNIPIIPYTVWNIPLWVTLDLFNESTEPVIHMFSSFVSQKEVREWVRQSESEKQSEKNMTGFSTLGELSLK